MTTEPRLRWLITPDGFKAGPYRIFRNTRGGFALWFAEPDGLRLVNQECDTLSGAKMLAAHDQEQRMANFGRTIEKLIHGERV